MRALRATFVVLSLGLVACAGPTAADPSGDQSPATTVDRLDGTGWTLHSVDDQPVPDGITATLVFTAGSASGSSGCNTFTGPYVARTPTLEIGPLASTRMACDDAVMTFEQAYLAALEGVTTWAVPADAVMGTQLSLTGTGPKLVLGPPAPG